jgi:CRISPR-associated protein Csd1
MCANAPQFATRPLMPVSHTEQQAHIEIVLDESGNFERAALVPQKEVTVVPATEESAGRTGTRPPPHPLCDKILYCAADYPVFGGAKASFYKEYIQQLGLWAKSGLNPKVQAVLSYVQKGTVVSDLVREGILYCSANGQLLTEWTSDHPTPGIFKMLTAKDGKRDQGDAFVRWRVQIPGDPVSAVWEAPDVRDSWVRFDASQNESGGLCMVTGQMTLLAASHPKRLRHGADGAKLISSNDASGYTFRGRFQVPEQAYGVGAVVTQKAHNALRWLIARQGYHDKATGQVFLAWAVDGQDIPDPFKNTAQMLGEGEPRAHQDERYSGDAGQHFALRLNKLISGYAIKLGARGDVVVMGLDSATPGRMAITYYRELIGTEFLDRILSWHMNCSWHQVYSKTLRFIGAPAPIDVAGAAYGRRLDDKLRKATVERLLPCIVDGRPLPRSIVEATLHRVSNRIGLEKWEWEKCLGIACALFRGSRWEESYQMSLEESRTTRDYLFGRLLAIAENIESHALYMAKEKRDTSAAKLMQRFASHPCSTWRNIELALTPYKTRLRSNRPGVLLKREKLLDSVICMFAQGDFTNDSKLSGEFLLGYHCQRSALWNKGETQVESEHKETDSEGEEE